MAKEKQDTSLFLLYPESIPSDWELKLELLGVPIAVSLCMIETRVMLRDNNIKNRTIM